MKLAVAPNDSVMMMTFTLNASNLTNGACDDDDDDDDVSNIPLESSRNRLKSSCARSGW